MEEGFIFGIGDAGETMTPLYKAPEIPRSYKTMWCPRCKSEFSSLTKLYRHKVQCTTARSTVAVCWSCKRTFPFRSLLLKHHCSRTHRRRQNNKKLLRKNLAMAKYWVEEQKKKKEYEPKESKVTDSESSSSRSSTPDLSFMTCNKCKAKFSSMKHFQLHLMHDLCQSEIVNCNICGREFDDDEELKFHRIRCKEKKLMMARLEEKYRKLQRQEYERSKQRRYSCKSCKKCYPAPQFLKRHLQKHPYCTRVHNLKIKLQCLWERGEDLERTARKSFSNCIKTQTKPFPILKKLRTLSDRRWESDSSASSEIQYESPVVGAARKSFRGLSQRDESGSFCDVCYRYFSSPVALKVHKEKHYQSEKKQTVSKCPQCLEFFPDTASLIAHQNALDHWGKATKSINSSCSCPLCGKEFSLVQSRNAHLRTHVDTHSEEVEKFLQETICEHCSQIFANGIAKTQHIKLKHSNQLPVETENKIERKVNDPELIYQSHKYVGYSKNVIKNITPSVSDKLKSNPTQCPICLKNYSTSFIRNRHFRTHTLDQAFECKFCPTKFPRSDRLTQHMQQCHNDCLGYECRECGSRFTTRMRALQHGSKAHPQLPAKNLIKERNVFTSSLHRKYTKYASALTTANSNETTCPDEEFYCDVCELSFLKLCGLQRHRQSKLHREILEKSQAAAKKKENLVTEPETVLVELRPPLSQTPPFIDYSKKLSCSTCSIELESVNEFVPHRLSHFSLPDSGEKVNELNPYTCEICGKVMDNAQKIQLHLFWHLQDVQLQAGPKKTAGSKNSLPSIPNILNMQPVAKKSINKPGKKQELVIAGVKKPLFTCEACNIGFTTKQHYTVHIQQYCRARKQVPENEQLKVFTGSSPSSEKTVVKSAAVTAGFCKICGCIFSSSTYYEDHKTMFCNKNTYTPLNENAENLYTEMVKSLMKLDSMVAGCVRCNIAFDSMQALSEHTNKHVLTESSMEITSDNLDLNVFNNSQNDESVNEDNYLAESSCNNVEFAEIEQNDDDDDETAEETICHPENVNHSPNSELSQEMMAVEDSDGAPEDTIEPSDSIDSLRANFSRLLCVLVSDQELMQELGYGKQPIDDVLVNVLHQMGLVPVPKEEICSEVERLSRNIRILLDVCIKDQVMELIANGQATTDSIVIAALKMFGVEDSSPTDLVTE